jgi:hypothetical protein
MARKSKLILRESKILIFSHQINKSSFIFTKGLDILDTEA